MVNMSRLFERTLGLIAVLFLEGNRSTIKARWLYFLWKYTNINSVIICLYDNYNRKYRSKVICVHLRNAYLPI